MQGARTLQRLSIVGFCRAGSSARYRYGAQQPLVRLCHRPPLHLHSAKPLFFPVPSMHPSASVFHPSLSSAPPPIPVWPVPLAKSTLGATLGPRRSTWSTSASTTLRTFPSSLFRFLPSTHRLSAATAAVGSAPVRQVSPSTRPRTSHAGASFPLRRLHLSPAPQSSFLLFPTDLPLSESSSPLSPASDDELMVPGSSPSIVHGATPFSLLSSVSSASLTSTVPPLLKLPLWLSTSFSVSSGPSFFLGRCPSPTSSTPFCGIPSSLMTADFPPPFSPPALSPTLAVLPLP